MKVNGKFVVRPSLSEVFDFHADDVGSKLHVSCVGEIVSYDRTTRTASIAIGKTFVLPNGTLLPVANPIQDVPVFTLQGAGIHVGMPIVPGDECLVVFNDFNIDQWFAQGGQPVPEDTRQHDFSDAIAFVGLNSQTNPLETFLTATEGGLASVTSKVAIDAATELITIANDAENLAAILNTLLTAQQAALAALGTDPGLQTATKTAALAAAAATTAAISALELLLY